MINALIGSAIFLVGALSILGFYSNMFVMSSRIDEKILVDQVANTAQLVLRLPAACDRNFAGKTLASSNDLLLSQIVAVDGTSILETGALENGLAISEIKLRLGAEITPDLKIAWLDMTVQKESIFVSGKKVSFPIGIQLNGTSIVRCFNSVMPKSSPNLDEPSEEGEPDL